jgi:hypothetical protein
MRESGKNGRGRLVLRPAAEPGETMTGLRAGAHCAALAALLVCGGAARAQDMPPVPAPLSPAPAPNPAPSAPAPAKLITIPQKLSGVQLDQLVAPIALYPDPLLGQVLMASTYPLEVVEAARWSRVPANRALGAAAQTAALRSKDWDPSVMALAPFPSLLAVMADKLEWIEKLGDAFLAQQADVMAAVQRLRHAALDAGNLKATPECHCIIQTSADTIAILPSDAQLVSVPVYSPTIVYGTWADANSPPVAFPPPEGFASAPGLAVGFAPAVEVALYGPLWGWGTIDWQHRRIAVDAPRYAAIAPGRPAFIDGVWVHESMLHHPVAANAPAAVLRGPSRTPAVPMARRFALTHPARPFPASRRHAWALPPGTIVPPPPPPHHAAIGGPYGLYGRY